METTFFINNENIDKFLAAAKVEDVTLVKKEVVEDSPGMFKVTVQYNYPFNLFYLGCHYILNVRK
jgi:hypothetical protein